MVAEIYKNDTLTDEFVNSFDFKEFISLYRSPFSLYKSPIPPIPPPPDVHLRDFKVFHFKVNQEIITSKVHASVSMVS